MGEAYFTSPSHAFTDSTLYIISHIFHSCFSRITRPQSFHYHIVDLEDILYHFPVTTCTK